MSHEEIYITSPVLILLVDERMEIVHHSRAASTLFQGMESRTLNDILGNDAVSTMAGLHAKLRSDDPPVSQLMTVVSKGGAELLIPCLVDKVDSQKIGMDNATELLRITALNDPEGQRAAASFAESARLLRDVVETANEAMWCIEFSEPIDTAAGTQEVVRQVFTNECRWLMSNKAMARLYDLPDGVDFEKQAVSLYFQRNAENEAFVSQIVESGYSIDNALSVDVRHDGSTIYVENTVRAHIIDGRLVRLWGTLRDVTGYRQTQNQLQQQVENVNNVLGAIPYALLVIDRDRVLSGVNPAFERHFGWRAEQLLGRDVQRFVDLENTLPDGRQWYGCDRHQWIAEVTTSSGKKISCEALISPIGEEAPDRFILTLCPFSQAAAAMAKPEEGAK